MPADTPGIHTLVVNRATPPLSNVNRAAGSDAPPDDSYVTKISCTPALRETRRCGRPADCYVS